MLFSAQIMYFYWEFYLPATLTISAPLSWPASPAAEESSPSLGAWKGSWRWWWWQLGLPRGQMLGCPVWVHLAVCLRPARQQNLPKAPVLVGKDLGQQHPSSPAESKAGCTAPPPKPDSFAWRVISSLQNLLEGCDLPQGLMKGRGSFLSGVCLHGVVAPVSGAPSVTLLSVGHGKAWCLPENTAGLRRRRQRQSFLSASPAPSRPPSGTALLYF